MKSPYRHLAVMLSINTIVMFLITYTMLSSLSHFYVNINRAYMSLMMVAPMGILMVVMMRSMYQDTKRNTLLIGGFVILFLGSLLLARTQTPVGDNQFLRSMMGLTARPDRVLRTSVLLNLVLPSLV
jgi:hypothetical protein